MKMDDFKYEKNFLTNVIFRLDIGSILDLNANDNFTKFKKDVFEILPISSEVKNITKNVNIELNIITDKENISYVFENQERTYKFSLSQSNLVIECTKYKNFPDFYEIIEKIINSFTKIYKPISFIRLGLRYVNQIKIERGHTFIWKDYLDKSLTASMDIFLGGRENLSRAMSSFTMNNDDNNSKLVIIYGMYNSDFPSKIYNKEFILDFDCFTDEIERNEDILIKLSDFNEVIKKMFELSIKDGLRKIMKIIE